MAVLLRHRLNPDSSKQEILDFTVIPKEKRPQTLDSDIFYIEETPPDFYKEWWKYYIEDNVLLLNGTRIGIEAASGV